MFYYLFQWLDAEFNIPGTGLFQYISFRAACCFICSMLIVIIFGKSFIRAMHRYGIGEETRDDEREKQGTPTMGGLLIIIAILIPTLLFARPDRCTVHPKRKDDLHPLKRFRSAIVSRIVCDMQLHRTVRINGKIADLLIVGKSYFNIRKCAQIKRCRADRGQAIGFPGIDIDIAGFLKRIIGIYIDRIL